MRYEKAIVGTLFVIENYNEPVFLLGFSFLVNYLRKTTLAIIGNNEAPDPPIPIGNNDLCHMNLIKNNDLYE